MKSALLILSIISFSFVGFSQKDGKYLTKDSPVNNLWQSVDGEDGGAPILGGSQEFFFLLPDGESGSMMALFEDGEYGFACPSYFTVSLDKKFLYLDVESTCALDTPEEELYIKIAYKMNADQTQLILIVDGVEYAYGDWKID